MTFIFYLGGFWYEAYSSGTDAYLYDNPEFVFVVAAGNGGAYGARTVLSPALAKNSIAVAASETTRNGDQLKMHNLASFSAIGPSPDGRIKPDIAAPGHYTISANAAAGSSTGASSATCSTSSKSGTSMAT